MLNNICLEGYVASEVDFNTVSTNKLVVNFRLSVPRIGKAKEKQLFDVFTCVAWNQVAKRIIDHVEKGQLISIVCHGESGDFCDRETGKTVYTTKFVVDQVNFLPNKEKELKL